MKPVLRIRDDYPESEFFNPGFRVKKIPDTGYGSASASKNLSFFNPKNCFYALGNMIRDVPDPDFLLIPDPGVKKAPDPGSATLNRGSTEQIPNSIALPYFLDNAIMVTKKRY